MMALLHCDGFDNLATTSAGLYNSVGFIQPVVVMGRGTGYAIRGTSALSSRVELVKPFPNLLTTFVVGIAFKNASKSAGTGATVIGFRSAGTVTTWLRVNSLDEASPGRVSVQRGVLTSSTPTELAASSTLISGTTWCYIEVKMTCSTGTGGSVVIRQDGVETANVSGLNTGMASVDGISIRLGCYGPAAADVGFAASVDDWYICDTSGSVNNNFLGDMSVLTLFPKGNGANSGLTGSDGNSTDNYALVDDVPPSGSDYAGADTAGLKDTYSFTDVRSGTPLGVLINAQASGYGSGRTVARGSNGTLSTGSDLNMISSSVMIPGTVLETDPATGSAWTMSGLNNAEFGWEVR